MRWVRVAAHFPTYGVSGPPPAFRITSDDDGVANLEIAKEPRFLAAPVSDARDPWTQFSSQLGAPQASVQGVQIPIRSGFADYALPEVVFRSMAEGQSVLYYRIVASRAASGARAFQSHTDAEAQRFEVPTLSVLAGSNGAAAGVTIEAAVRAGLPAWALAMLDLFLSIEGLPERELLPRVLAHEVYAQATVPQRVKILELFTRCSTAARELFPRLLDLRVEVGSGPAGGVTRAALFVEDEVGEATLLEHLNAIYDIPLHPRVALSQSDLLYDVLYELVDPGNQLNQGLAGTCAATSVQIYTSMRNPAEVARWARYLLDARHHRVRLQNGDFMRCSTQAFSRATWNNLPDGARNPSTVSLFTRTYSERAIQAALMDYANFRATYDPVNDEFRQWLFITLSSGLWEFEITRLVEAIFDQGWAWDFGGAGLGLDNPDQASVAQALVSRLDGGLPVFVVMRWGSGAHAVVGLRVEGNRLVFRNPQYRGGFPMAADGAQLAQPPRRVHRAIRAEESIGQADLAGWVRGFLFETGSDERGYRLGEIPPDLRSTVTPTR